MTLRRKIKDAYIENGDSIYVKTHSNAIYVDDNETETLTQRLDNVKDSITEIRSQISTSNRDINNIDSLLLITDYTNIFDYTKCKENKILNTWSDTVTINNYDGGYKDGWFISDLFNVSNHIGETIYFYQWKDGIQSNDYIIHNVLFFNSDGNLISKLNGNFTEITIPVNCSHMVFSTNYKSSDLMATWGQYTGKFIPYNYKEPKLHIDSTFTKEKYAPDSKKTGDRFKNIEEKINLIDKSHIIFSFDGTGFDNRYSIMKEYGFPFTIALNTAFIQYPIPKDRYYNDYIANDIDLSIYGWNGDAPSSYIGNTQSEWDNVITSMVNGIKEGGVYYPIMYSCSQMKISDNLTNAIKKQGFRMCRCTDYLKEDGTTEYLYREKGYGFKGTDSFYYPAYGIYKDSKIEDIKRQIDSVIAEKKSMIIFTHFIKEESDPTISDNDSTITTYRAMLDYIKELVEAGKCDVMNARQYWNFYNKEDGQDLDYKRVSMRSYYDSLNNA